MTRFRDALPVLLSVAAGAAVIYGVYLWLGPAAAWITGGIGGLLAAWAVES